jgi:hypothetical protein
VYDRYENHLRLFGLERGRYQEVQLEESRFWFEALGLGLGIWEGAYQGVVGRWLRWYDQSGGWLPTLAEQASLATLQAEQANDRAERLAAKLRELGVDPDSV